MTTIEPTYGSDRNGLVWAFALETGRPARSIEADEATALLAAPQAGQFLWLHFSLSNAASERWIRQHLSPPESFLATLHEGLVSTRLEQEDESLVAVVHDVLFDFAFDPADISTVSLCVLPGVLVTARLKPLRSVDRLRAAVKLGEIFRSPADLLAHLLRDQVRVLVEIVRQTTSRVDQIEDQLLQQKIQASRAELGALRRVLVRLQRLLAPEPAALFRLLSRPPSWIGGADLDDLRQSAEEFATAVADSAALVERVKLIQEELAALNNEQNNRILFLLTVATVVALPINLTAGLFGMNVGGIPFGSSARGFATIVALVVALTAGLGLLMARWGR